MKEETINNLTAQAKELRFAEGLPTELEGFVLRKVFAADEDKFIFFTCADETIHCALTAYFHTETNEFKLRQRIGLTEFCLTNFFTEDFAHFKELLDAELAEVIKNLRGVRCGKFNRFLRDVRLDTWAYGLSLPATLEGFELYISPAAPVEVTNGSVIVINYADFAIAGDFALSYNIYTDEFGSEERINGATRVTYAFDAKTLDEVEAKLKDNLLDELREIRRLATSAKE